MKKRNIILIILLTMVVLFLALKDDYNTIIGLLLNADIRFLFLSFLLVMGYCFMKAMILHTLVNEVKPYPFLDSIKLQLMTFFFNAITPFSSGGQPFQVYILKKERIDISYGTNIIAQESILHQISIIALGFVALILNKVLNIYEVNDFLLYLIILGFILNFIVLFLFFSLAYMKKVDSFILDKISSILTKLHILKSKEKTLNNWNRSLEKFNECSKKLLNNKKKLIKLALFNIVGLISIYLVPITILYSFHNFTAYNSITALVLTTFVALIGSYVPLPGGTGGQEFVFILLFGLYVQNPLLNSIMILWRFITYYLPMIIGAILFNIRKKEI